MKQVIIDRAKWRFGGTMNTQKWVDYYGPTRLYNGEGFKCCLGFACLQLDPTLSESEIFRIKSPHDIVKYRDGFKNLLTELNEHGYDADKSWVKSAIRINDNSATSLTERENLLTKLFGDNDIELIFEGAYTPEQLKIHEAN